MQRVNVLIALVIAFAFSNVKADEMTQSDWSGGQGVHGPVTGWGDAFDSETDVNWSGQPGGLILAQTPSATPAKHIVADATGFPEVAGLRRVFTRT